MSEEFNSAYAGAEIDAAIGAVRQKEAAWDGKQDKLTGSAGQLVGFNEAGEAAAQEAQSFAGPAGPKGEAGKSAYEVAVENGYTGTVQAWLKSLIGVQPLIIKGSVSYAPEASDSSMVYTTRVSLSNFNRHPVSFSENFIGFVRHSDSLYYVEGAICEASVSDNGSTIFPNTVKFSQVLQL